MEVLKIKRRTPTEIVFVTCGDMVKFYDEITDGKPVVFDFVDGKPRAGDIINPAIKTDISDGKIKVRFEERE